MSDWCFFPCLRIPICLFNWFLLVYCLILARSFSVIRYLSLLCFLFVCYKYCLPELKYTYYTYFVSFTCFIFVCIDFVSSGFSGSINGISYFCVSLSTWYLLFFFFFNGILHFQFHVVKYALISFQSVPITRTIFVCFTYKLSREKLGQMHIVNGAKMHFIIIIIIFLFYKVLPLPCRFCILLLFSLEKYFPK